MGKMVIPDLKANMPPRVSCTSQKRTKGVPRRLLASIPPVDTEHCPFLELSAELRNLIYEYALAPKAEITIITKETFAQSALLRTCKTIRSEASSIYYLGTNFQFIIKDFDASLLMAFRDQFGIYHQRARISYDLKSSSKSWENLLVWLKAYSEDKVGGYRCHGMGCRKGACCKASMAFDVAQKLAKVLEWEDLLEMLELVKKATEQKKHGTWAWT